MWWTKDKAVQKKVLKIVRKSGYRSKELFIEFVDFLGACEAIYGEAKES